MHIVRGKDKKTLIKNIRKNASSAHKHVYVNLRPTLDIIEEVKKHNPKVERITCPPSLYAQTSKKVFEHLGESGIKFEAGDFKVGRPVKYEDDIVKTIFDQRASGVPVKQISENINMPLRTVYFYLKNNNQ